MKIYLGTLEDIAFNNLMPWLDRNSDMDLFEEIVRTIDINKIKDYQIFFLHLIEMHKLTDIAITPSTLNEWKAFSCIKRNKKTEALTNHLTSFVRRDAKVSFYTFLIANTVSAIMSSLQEQMAIFGSIPLKKQFVDKYVIRLKRIIEADIPFDDHSEDDLLIIKFVKLGALAIYILLLLQYKKFIHPCNELTHNDIMTAFAGISMTDKGLAKTASALMQVYGNFVKRSTQASPTNKLKELKQQAAMKTGGQDITLPEKQTTSDQRTSENQIMVNSETTGSREGEDERLIGSKALMHILEIDRVTLYRWRNREDNKIPYYQHSKRGKILYKMSEINAWLKRNPEIHSESETSKSK